MMVALDFSAQSKMLDEGERDRREAAVGLAIKRHACSVRKWKWCPSLTDAFHYCRKTQRTSRAMMRGSPGCEEYDAGCSWIGCRRCRFGLRWRRRMDDECGFSI
jgi:hypothetical protein